MDHLKWFGEGFDGFPKTLPEDCVEYTLYVIDSSLSDLNLRNRLRQIQAAADSLVKHLLRDFIWQRDSFGLELARQDGTSLLHGKTNYGDSVEDEWLVVFLLRELSKQSSDIWIRVVDTDGEFLLIEAANKLPPWLNPEIAHHRVWINDGRLFIIPPQLPCQDIGRMLNAPETVTNASEIITLEEARHIIHKNRARLQHLPQVEAEAFDRLRKYPEQIAYCMHHALVLVPRNLAYVIHNNASHISPAVEAFYLRDPVSLRPLQMQDIGKLVFPPKDLVTISVKFTKVGYAQMKSQHFIAPAVWSSVLSPRQFEQSKGEAEIGMKVTCGFEMLLSDSQNQDKRPVREILMLLQDIEAGEDHLPSDAEIAQWEHDEDSEEWLDINFEDFENELVGKRTGDTSSANRGFGDRNAQENLRKMVARFEDFLENDAAGADGAEFRDDMDSDDEEDENTGGESSVGSESASEGEDDATDIEFDENRFADLMREMMGIPSGRKENFVDEQTIESHLKDMPEFGEDDSTRDEEQNDIHQIMQTMEAELRGAGALQLDPLPTTATKQRRTTKAKSNGPDRSNADSSEEGTEDGGEVHIDFNLAKNMLESFKSQGGMPGPGGNLIGLMGMHLPRDEDETLLDAHEP